MGIVHLKVLPTVVSLPGKIVLRVVLDQVYPLVRLLAPKPQEIHRLMLIQKD
jgi:hypothetical protein